MPLRDPAIQTGIELALVAHELHQRIGQLIVNILEPDQLDNLFYLSDEELLAFARAYFEVHVPRPKGFHPSVPSDPDSS